MNEQMEKDVLFQMSETNKKMDKMILLLTKMLERLGE